jgi:hypothetical protein
LSWACRLNDCSALTAPFLNAGENIMPSDDDSFEQALREYHEETWDPAEFADLPTNVQCDIVERAYLIRAANDRLKAA